MSIKAPEAAPWEGEDGEAKETEHDGSTDKISAEGGKAGYVFATLLARLKRFELTSGHAAAGSDQGFLQQFFREHEGFLSLPHAYNVLKRREKKLGKSFRIQDVFVLHLVGGKPWEPGDPGAGEYPLSHGAWHAIRRECGLPDDGY